MNQDVNNDLSGEAWREDCIKWRGHILTGKFGHWCYDWDELPVDETCIEFVCDTCFDSTPEIEAIKLKLQEDWDKLEAEVRSGE